MYSSSLPWIFRPSNKSECMGGLAVHRFLPTPRPRSLQATAPIGKRFYCIQEGKRFVRGRQRNNAEGGSRTNLFDLVEKLIWTPSPGTGDRNANGTIEHRLEREMSLDTSFDVRLKGNNKLFPFIIYFFENAIKFQSEKKKNLFHPLLALKFTSLLFLFFSFLFFSNNPE